MRILIPIPSRSFDCTEVAVPWSILLASGHEVTFATPDGKPGECDDRLISGRGFGPWKSLLRASEIGRQQYSLLLLSPSFQNPLRYEDLRVSDFNGIIIPGGHDKVGMRAYLESPILQKIVGEFFHLNKPVGAICHGVVLLSRSVSEKDGRSVLYGRRVSGLTKALEMSGYALTRLWLGDYYLTYPTSVEDEVKGALKKPTDFIRGPWWKLQRDTMEHIDRGFVVRDGNLVTSRWPGDAHCFALSFLEVLQESAKSQY